VVDLACGPFDFASDLVDPPAGRVLADQLSGAVGGIRACVIFGFTPSDYQTSIVQITIMALMA
jgi:hypothetical protein